VSQSQSFSESSPNKSGNKRLRYKRHSVGVKEVREEGEWCHQCKQKHVQVLCCTAACTKKYCTRCLLRHYHTQLDTVDVARWICPYCTGACSCAQCRKSPTLDLDLSHDDALALTDHHDDACHASTSHRAPAPAPVPAPHSAGGDDDDDYEERWTKTRASRRRALRHTKEEERGSVARLVPVKQEPPLPSPRKRSAEVHSIPHSWAMLVFVVLMLRS